MMEFVQEKKFYIAGGICALIVASWLSSLALYIMLHMDPELARPWTVWYFLPDDIFHTKALISLGAVHMGLLWFGIWLFKDISIEKHIGGARWANAADLRKAGLFAKSGILLGKYWGQYLVSDSPTHVMVMAPTRSGKGAGLVIPNLLGWADSVICLDIKQENYQKTAGFRQAHGQKTYMWAPVSDDLKSHCYNPLDAVSKHPHKRITDVQTIAKILVPDPSHGDDFWASEARSLFTGLVLYVLDSPEMAPTIGSVYRILGAEGDLGDICRHIVTSYPELPTGAKKTLMSFANKAEKERSGVKSSLDKALHLWTEPAIDAVTSKSDFFLSDLRKERMSIYVGVPTDQVGRISSLLRLFVEQTITALASRIPGTDEPYKVLLILDEMHMLGDMPSMTTIFSLLAGYNVRIMAVVQNISTLDQAYGKDKRNVILSGCAHQVFFAPNELSTPEYVSKSCGNKIVETVSLSKKQSFKYEPASRNTGQAVRPLLSEADMKLMSGNDQLMLVERCRPVRSKKIVYFKDGSFKGRLLEPPKIPDLKIEEQKIPKFNIVKRSKPEDPDDLSDSSAPMPYNPPNNSPSLDGMLDLMPEESASHAVGEGLLDSIMKVLRDED